MTTSADIPLAIGSIVGDWDQSKTWGRSIGELSQRAEALSIGTRSPVNLNVVFQVSGRIFQPEFEGVRTGRFNRARSVLVVQAAVPAEQVEVDRSVLLDLLDDAVSEAERYVVRKKLADGLPEIRSIVEQLHQDQP